MLSRKMSVNASVMLVAASLILAWIASLLWLKISLTSDSLFLDSLSDDLFNLGGKWSDWTLTGAPAYFPDMLLYFLSYKILPNATCRIFFVSVAQVFILTGAILWSTKQIYPNISRAALAIMILLVAFTTLVAERSDMWLYFYSTNNHFAALIVPMINIGLIIKFYTTRSKTSALCLMILGVAAQASTSLYIITFLAPVLILTLLLLTIGLQSRQDSEIKLGRIFIILSILIVSWLSACWVDSLMNPNTITDRLITFNLYHANDAFEGFERATMNLFSLENKSSIVFRDIVLLSLCFLIYKLLSTIKIKHNVLWIPVSSDSHWRIIFCAALLILVIPTNIIGMILSGGAARIYPYRYLAFPIALILMLLVIIVDKSYGYNGKLWRIIFIPTSFLLIALSIYTYYHHPLPPENNSTKIDSPLIAECLIDIEKRGFYLQEGVADFCGALSTSAYLPKKNWILVTSNDLTPKYWMNSIAPIKRSANHQYYYNFIILRYEYDARDEFNYNNFIISQVAPKPSHIYLCPQVKAEIWLYDNNSLNAVIASKAKQYLLLGEKSK